MNDLNKKNLIQFGKGALVGLSGILAVITFSGVLNGVVANGLDAFYGWVAGLNLIAEGGLCYLLYKKLFKSEK